MDRARHWLKRVAGALRRRVRRLNKRLDYALTYLWRTLMVRTTVIAITGSTGKTTAKECLHAILASVGPTMATFQNENDDTGVPRTIRRMRPWHRFAVVEVGTLVPGTIRRSARLLRPDVVVELCVGRTHVKYFRALEDTAAEKVELIEGARKRATVILNTDDPWVAGMAERAGNRRVLRFGRGDGCDYRATQIASRWPQRFGFELHVGGVRHTVQTRLVGTHWLGSVLGALAAADACGVEPHAAIAPLGGVAPFMGRMQPVVLPGGAVLIRDEENGSPDTVDAMFAVVKDARAERRGLIFSDLSDERKDTRRRLAAVGRLAAEHCDYVAFVGSHAHRGVAAAIRAGLAPDACGDFVDVQSAAAWLRQMAREGDLIFLKGRTTDHLSRILFAQFGDIDCSVLSCNIRRLCDVCPRLRPAFDLTAVLEDPLDVGAPAAAGEIRSAARPVR